MKKILVFAAMAVFSMGAMFAQNNFRGTITYSVTSTGSVAYQVPAEISTAEIKVYDDKVMTSSVLFTNNPMVQSVLVDGMTQYTCMDLSMILMYLAQNDVELDYDGSSKILISHKYTQNDVDSLTIPVTEGYYIEYVAGETKTIAGYTAKKSVLHIFTDDGEKELVFWYTDEIGPAVNFLFNGVKGVALEYVMDLGEGKQLTLSASEIKKGKIKEVDMLLPSGFEEIPQEKMEALFKQISEEMEYLNEE